MRRRGRRPRSRDRPAGPARPVASGLDREGDGRHPVQGGRQERRGTAGEHQDPGEHGRDRPPAAPVRAACGRRVRRGRRIAASGAASGPRRVHRGPAVRVVPRDPRHPAHPAPRRKSGQFCLIHSPVALDRPFRRPARTGGGAIGSGEGIGGSREEPSGGGEDRWERGRDTESPWQGAWPSHGLFDSTTSRRRLASLLARPAARRPIRRRSTARTRAGAGAGAAGRSRSRACRRSRSRSGPA